MRNWILEMETKFDLQVPDSRCYYCKEKMSVLNGHIFQILRWNYFDGCACVGKDQKSINISSSILSKVYFFLFWGVSMQEKPEIYWHTSLHSSFIKILSLHLITFYVVLSSLIPPTHTLFPEVGGKQMWLSEGVANWCNAPKWSIFFPLNADISLMYIRHQWRDALERKISFSQLVEKFIFLF